MANKKTPVKKTTDSGLEKRIKELEQLVQLLSKNNTPNIVTPIINAEKEDILFISLCPEVLNLTANVNGNFMVYKFKEFGEEQRIPYVDAKILVKHNSKFINQGAVYIDDKDFIKTERLTQYYKNILNQDEIISLFTADKEKFKEQFKRMPKLQKEIFARMIGYKIHKGEEVDMNVVQSVNQSLNINIIKNIKNGEGLITPDK